MKQKGNPFGYVCPVCQKGIYDKEGVVHTDSGMAHSKCQEPNTVEHVGRQVIENKLLTALQDGGVVAILATQQDLDDLIASLYGYERGEAFTKRKKDLAESFSQLRREAFGEATGKEGEK